MNCYIQIEWHQLQYDQQINCYKWAQISLFLNVFNLLTSHDSYLFMPTIFSLTHTLTCFNTWDTVGILEIVWNASVCLISTAQFALFSWIFGGNTQKYPLGCVHMCLAFFIEHSMVTSIFTLLSKWVYVGASNIFGDSHITVLVNHM